MLHMQDVLEDTHGTTNTLVDPLKHQPEQFKWFQKIHADESLQKETRITRLNTSVPTCRPFTNIRFTTKMDDSKLLWKNNYLH